MVASGSHTRRPPPFEKISHLGELLIVIFYADAYTEAISAFLAAYRRFGLRLGPVLVSIIFISVTVRFFVGNHLHLCDDRWNELDGDAKQTVPDFSDSETTWTTSKHRRRLYYFDAFFIATESFAMILLGGLAGDASVRLLVGLLIIISAIDVVWIGAQMLLSRWWGGQRPDSPLYKWLLLNVAVIIALLFPLSCGWGHTPSTAVLLEITAITFLAFFVDIFVLNLPQA